MPPPTARPIDRVIAWMALPFLITALFHAHAVFLGASDDGSSPLRHGIFAVINTLAALGLYFRPPFLIVAITILAAQQLWSHGSDLHRLWTTEARIDYPSLAVVVFFPVLVLLLAKAEHARGRDST